MEVIISQDITSPLKKSKIGLSDYFPFKVIDRFATFNL